MSEFQLEKFPVVSENGNEYLVSVFQDTHWHKHVTARVYVKRKGLFGRDKFVCIQGGNMFDRSVYDEEKWNYDYIAVAMNEVRKYENRIAREIQHEINRKEGAKRFEEWNGGAE